MEIEKILKVKFLKLGDYISNGDDKLNICEDFNISISTLNRKIRSFNKNSISL